MDAPRHHRGAVLLAIGDLDLGRGDHVDVVLFDRLDVVLRQRVLQRLLPGDLAPETRFQQTPRCFARPESGDPHVAGELLERGVDRALELGRGDDDVKLDAVRDAGGTVVRCVVFVDALDGLDGALHKEGEVYR